MDHIDRKIIDLLQNNARAPLKEIADHVFLSSPAVSARMARLESSGAIMSYQAQVAAPMLGYMVKAFINLDMDPQRKPEFYPYIESCPHVVECNCVTGDYSMLIEVLFATTQELDQFINHLQQFGRTRTQIVFSTPVEHRGVPRLTAMAASTWRITPSSSRPIFSRRRRLSRVRICSVKIMLSLARPQRSARTLICVGRRFLSCRLVMAAAITVGLCRLPISFWIISTGRIPPCSLPTTGLRSA